MSDEMASDGFSPFISCLRLGHQNFNKTSFDTFEAKISYLISVKSFIKIKIALLDEASRFGPAPWKGLTLMNWHPDLKYAK